MSPSWHRDQEDEGSPGSGHRDATRDSSQACPSSAGRDGSRDEKRGIYRAHQGNNTIFLGTTRAEETESPKPARVVS